MDRRTYDKGSLNKMDKKWKHAITATLTSVILTSIAALPASAAPQVVVKSQVEPVCVMRGWPRKEEDCSIRDSYQLIQTSDRAVRAMHLQLAEGEKTSTRKLWVGLAKSPGPACISAMREGQLQLLPKLAASRANFENGLAFIAKVELVLELADRKSQGQALFKALAEFGFKGASKQIAKEAASEISPDVKAGLLDLAKALATSFAAHRFSNLVRGDYFYNLEECL